MDDLTYFDRVASLHGCGHRLDLTGVDSIPARLLRERAEEVRRLLSIFAISYPTLPPVHFDFIDHLGVQALAFGHPQRKQYYIGYSAMTELTLLLLFNRMLADPDLLKHVGHPGLEAPDLPTIGEYIGSAPDIEAFTRVHVTIPDPTDHERYLFANYLRHVVGHFVIMHEMAHLIQGHIEFNSKYLGLQCIVDPGEIQADAKKRLIRQSLEMHADNQAAWEGLSAIHSNIVAPDLSPSPFDAHYRNPSETLHAWLFAVFVFCRLFGDQKLAGSDLTVGQYPPWRFRQRMIMEAVGSMVADEVFGGVFGTKESAIEVIGRSLDDAERSWSRVTGRLRSHLGLIDSGDTVRDHKARLVALWAEEIEPRLVRYPHQTSLAAS